MDKVNNLTVHLGVELSSREDILRRTTIEDFIAANGTLANFLDAFADFALENGFDWKAIIMQMRDHAERRARLYTRMGL